MNMRDEFDWLTRLTAEHPDGVSKAKVPLNTGYFSTSAVESTDVIIRLSAVESSDVTATEFLW